MKKRKYEIPEMEVLEVELQGILMASGDDDHDKDDNGGHTGPGGL